MGSFVCFLIGAFVGCGVIFALFDWALFKRIITDRFTSRVLAGFATYIVSVLIYGFGAANDGEFRFDGFVVFLIPSLAILAFAIKQARNERADAAGEALRSS